MMKKDLSLLVLVNIFSLLSLSACGNPLGGSKSTLDAGHSPGVSEVSLAPAKGTEFVSSSQQMKPTKGAKFLVQGTLTSATNEVLLKTPTRGYQLFSNVQGELISGGKGL